MVKLIELEPRWVAEYGAPDDAKQGVSFLCPHCRIVKLAVFFSPTICGRPPVDIDAFHKARWDEAHAHLEDHHVGATIWTRVSGETFDDLTLSPSIDASKWGCWHGFITNGEAL